MIRRLALVLVLALCAAPPAVASNDNVLCVQNQLAQRGYDPGPRDGLIGHQTYRAMRRMARALGVPAADRLSPGTALYLCRQFGLRDPSLQRFWPSQRGRVALIRTPDLPDALADLIAEYLVPIHALAADRMEVAIAGTDRVIAGTDRAAIASLFPGALQHGMLFESIDAALATQCADPSRLAGFTVSGVAVLCLPARLPMSRASTRADLLDLVAHEVQHLVTRQILRVSVGETAEERVQDLGPLWMHEGHAMVFADSVAQNATPARTRAAMLRHYRNRPLPDLGTLETREALDDHLVDVYRAGAIAVSLLIEEHGEPAMGRLYESMAEGTPFETAFAQVFGESLDAFYAAYAGRARPRVDGRTARAPAADAVRCVQTALNAAGFDAGGADGRIGPRTRAALAAYREARGIPRDPAIAAADAPAWCRIIGLREEGLRDLWPARDRSVQVDVVDSAGFGVVNALRERLARLHRSAAAFFLTPVAATDHVFAGRTAAEIRSLARAANTPLPGDLLAFLGAECDAARGLTAAVAPGVAVLCLGPDPMARIRGSRAGFDAELAEIAARLLWFQVVGADGANPAPDWFRAGLAQVFALSTVEALDSAAIRARMSASFPKGRLPDLAELVATGDDPVQSMAARRAGTAAVAQMIEARGRAALGRLITSLGLGYPFDEAFTAAMGMPQAAFLDAATPRRASAATTGSRTLAQGGTRAASN
ncbi:MAG: hypothetical protein Kow0013_17280 [Pararhodobacter sp.]